MSEEQPIEAEPVGGGAGGDDKDERMWGMICHLSALAGLTCIPFANLIAPFIVWMIKKDTYAFVDDQGKEAVNFQITMTIAGVGIMVLSFILPFIAFLGFGVMIVSLVFAIIGGLKANEGQQYRYPFALRLIK